MGKVRELPDECCVIRLRYDGYCHECNTRCRRGSRAIYDRAIRRFYCWHCATLVGWVGR